MTPILCLLRFVHSLCEMYKSSFGHNEKLRYFSRCDDIVYLLEIYESVSCIEIELQ